MKGLFIFTTLFITAISSILAQGVLDVNVRITNPYGNFSQSTIKHQRIIPWVEPNTHASKPINVAADGSSNKTEFRIYNMIPEPPISVPINQLEARLTDVDSAMLDPKYFGSLSQISATADEMILSYDHPQAFHPDFIEERYYEIGLEIGRLEEIPEQGEEWVAHSAWLIRIYRPPVLFIHGLWAGGPAFRNMEDSLYNSGKYGVADNDGTVNPNDRFHSLRVDYRPSNDFSFLLNQGLVPQHIAQLLHTRSKVIANKVDIVCHSMGAILTRMYLQNTLTAYNDDINKFITVNAPHAGAQSANLLMDPTVEVRTGVQLGRNIVCPIFDNLGFGNCYNGAIADLQVATVGNGLDALVNGNALNANKVSSFTITTTQTLENYTIEAPKLLSYTFEAVIGNILMQAGVECGESLGQVVFDNDVHDFIVPFASQNGGLSPASTTNVTNQRHNKSIRNPEIIEIVLDLLDAEPNGLPFAKNGFAPPALTYTSPSLPCGRLGAALNPSISIASPLAGSTFEPGSMLNIALEANEDVKNTMVLVQGNIEGAFVSMKESGELSHSLRLGDNIIGSKNIIALGFDALGVPTIVSDPVQIEVSPNATLDSIIVYPERIIVSDEGIASMQIHGYFSDSIRRDLSDMEGLIFSLQHGLAEQADRTSIRGIQTGIDSLAVGLLGIESSPVEVIVVQAPELMTNVVEPAIPQNKLVQPLRLFPNPTDGMVYVDMKKGGIAAVLTLDGRMVLSKQTNEAGVLGLDTSLLSNGVYIVKVQEDTFTRIGKLVKL